MYWISLLCIFSTEIKTSAALSATTSTRVSNVVSSTTTSTEPRTTRQPFSNRDRLDQVLMGSKHASPNFPKTWIPLAAVDHLDPNRPTPLQFMGAKYVCYQDNSGKWVVMDDACPHRLAPLSEGRIDSQKDVIECAYHGWQFDSQGKCKQIPQLDSGTFEKVVQNPKSCVASYPVTTENGMLWAWLWSDDVLSVAGIPEAHPEIISKGVVLPGSSSLYMRDMPYGWDTLMENLMDPAHVPFAHHGMQGTRDDAIPINMTTSTHVSQYGFRVEFEDRTMKRIRKGFGELRAPYLLNYKADYYLENGEIDKSVAPFSLATYCIPTRPGWSRVVVVPGQGSGDNDDKGKTSLVMKVFSLIPTWLLHILSGRFLDSDLAFLHYQEREARARISDNGRVADAYYIPAPADRSVSNVRQWIRTYARAWESLPLPDSPLRRDELFDRYSQHVQHCRHCQGALEGLKVWRRNSILVLATSIVGLQITSLATLPAVASLLLLALLGFIEKAIKEGGYEHYKT